MPQIAHSTYLDMTGYGLTTATDVPSAYGFPASSVIPSPNGVLVALTLNRANDPTGLLSEDWATRQTTLAQLTANNTLWTTYGANPGDYTSALSALHGLGLSTLGAADGYVTSAASRTIWADMTAAQFGTLFGTPLLSSTQYGLQYWNGSLSLPTALAGLVSGVWVDSGTNFPQATSSSDHGVTLAQGAQSIGNAGQEQGIFPNTLASLYDFPLAAGSAVPTPTVALAENQIGDTGVKSGKTFQSLLDTYRASAGIAAPGAYYAVEPAGLAASPSGERSLDVGVIAAAAPNSTIGLYAGGDTGVNGGYYGTSNFSVYQAAIWDTANHPADLSSSFSDDNAANPASPFYAAYNSLFQDAALRNISVFVSAGDGGSQEKYGSGAPMADQSHSSAYAVVVGGSSLATFAKAAQDPTLAGLLAAADAHDPATLRRLMAAGLNVLPSTGANLGNTLIETVWNQYYVDGSTVTSIGAGGLKATGGGFDANNAGAGGVDTTQPVPGYQAAFGLTPTSTGPTPATGRGVPDVSSTSGGDAAAEIPTADMSGLTQSGGTSGAAPLWAALTAQIQAVFADEGLPTTGYFNDLLYQAAALEPAAFNDVQLGNNNSTYIPDSHGAYVFNDSGGSSTQVTITGTGSSPYGYSAGPGYDLTTGLGTPNGLLLARTLTAIAQAQLYSTAPALTDGNGAFVTGGTLLVQPKLAAGGSVTVGGIHLATGAPDAFAWSSQLAGQAMQTGYDPSLITTFDGAAQGTPQEVQVAAGQTLAVAINGVTASPTQATLTSPFGFVETTDPSGNAVSLARPVSIAQTAQGASDQDAIVRIRQDGWDAAQLTFYRVDDFSGTVAGIAPGAAGYAAAAFAHAYAAGSGGTVIAGPGVGQQAQTSLHGVNAGDLVAAELTDLATGHQYWGFSAANEALNGAGVTHLWNYGLNTFGFEDGFQGGDRDYNDTVFQLDFTSAAHSQLLK